MSIWKSIIVGSLFSLAAAWAIPAPPFPIKTVQPDGSVVPVRIVGNEHFHYTVTSEDSVLVVRDSSGYWNYADENGKKTGIRVHSKSKRDQKEKNFLKKRNSRGILGKFREKHLKKLRERRENESSENSSTPQKIQSGSTAPMKANNWWNWGRPTEPTVTHTDWPMRPAGSTVKKQGQVRGIVILVEFSDVKFSSSDANAEFTDYLNKEGYSKYHMSGSVRDFFVQNSMGTYEPTFDVYGPIAVSGTRYSYGVHLDLYDVSKGAVKALNEALDKLVEQGVDFSPYDSDGDKVIDFIYMIYAGTGAADTGDEAAIWPHSHFLSKRLNSGYRTDRYACSGELDGQSYVYAKAWGRKSTVLSGIGTFCHEFSHVLGLMDHYDVNDDGSGTSTLYTPNAWDLMDAGSYDCPSNSDYSTGCSPANLSAFERFSLGWLEPRRLVISDTTFVLNPITENDGLVLTSENDDEYYFVDFRLQEGFDVGLPNKGMLIWHIKYSYTAWYNNMLNVQDPMCVDLVEADGKTGVNSIKDDAFPTSRVNGYNGFTTWSGTDLGLEVYDIKIVDRHVEFKTRGTRVSPVTSSSSGKAVSSSSAKSSSSVRSSSSAKSSSSSVEVVSSSSESSSSTELSSSSSLQETSSSSNFMPVIPISSSSSEIPLNSGKTFANKDIRFSVNQGVLTVNANVNGRKTIRLFDVNGTLLLTKAFDGESCEIRMSSLPGKSFVVGSLEINGRTIKTIKIQNR